MKPLNVLLLAVMLLLSSCLATAADICYIFRNYTDLECVAHTGNTTNFNKCKARKKYAEPPVQPTWLLDSQVVALNGAVQAEPPKLCYVKKLKKNKVLGTFRATQRHAFLAGGQTVITNPNIGNIDGGFVNPTPPPTVPPVVIPEVPPEPTTPTIVQNAVSPPQSATHCIWQGGTCNLPAESKVWYGKGSLWVSKTAVTGSFSCGSTLFGGVDPAPGEFKDCYYVRMSDVAQVLKPPAGVNYQPTVNKALSPAFAVGESGPLIGPAAIPPTHTPPYAGAFRISCQFSHMSNDDPIVFPGVPDATHHHTFFGNRAITAYTTPANIRSSGNSTCAGGILNRSGYWMPSLIDMSNGAPIAPSGVVVYYKAIDDYSGAYIKAPPAGLRMIAGNPRPLSISDSTASYYCQDLSQAGVAPHYGILWQGKTFQSCGGVNHMLRMIVNFPQCWDGVNLDSPDHQSHMAYNCRDRNNCLDENGGLTLRPNSCPASHPIAIPNITINADWRNVVAGRTYRLSSDNYPSTYAGGMSLHADWMNGWDESIINRVVKNCINGFRDCGGPNLGDGQTLTGFNVD